MQLEEEGGRHFEMVYKDLIQIHEYLTSTILKSEQTMLAQLVDLEIRFKRLTLKVSKLDMKGTMAPILHKEILPIPVAVNKSDYVRSNSVIVF